MIDPTSDNTDDTQQDLDRLSDDGNPHNDVGDE